MELAQISGDDLNADLRQLITVCADEMAWCGTELAGIDQKLFERIGRGGGARETGLVRLAAGSAIPAQIAHCRVDLLVLEGAVEIAGEPGPAGHFRRIPPGAPVGLCAAEDAVVLVKKRAVGTGLDPIALNTRDRTNWAPWGGRGSDKAQIYEPGVLPEASWVGFMLPDLTIPLHDHAGGEEIFILEGGLRDERGLYGPGTWVRFPAGAMHTPTSLGDGCLMLVREGDATPLAD
ncbi:MAG: cupin domain-containing protein [Alteraurantiacibacter sp.]